MELKDLQSNWQNTGKANKTKADLQKMLQLPALKRIRAKLLFEGISFALLLLFYYDWFDGNQKPFYANVMLLTSVITLLAKDIVGYISVVKPTIQTDVKTSLNHLLSRTVRLSRFSLLFSCLYSISLLIYFTSVIHFTREKSFILLGGIIILVQLLLWSQRIWTKSIRNLREQIDALMEE